MSFLENQLAAKRQRDMRLGKTPCPTAKLFQFPDRITPPVVIPVTEEAAEPINVPVNESSSTGSCETIESIKRGVSDLLSRLASVQEHMEESVLSRSIRSKSIILAVAKFYNVPYREMLSTRRHQAVVVPRHVAMYLLKELTLKSYPAIGRVMGGRDHTTAMSAVKKMTRRLETDPVLASDVAQLRSILEPTNV